MGVKYASSVAFIFDLKTVNAHPRRSHDGPEGNRGIDLFFL